MINLSGCALGAVKAAQIQSVLDSSTPEAANIEQMAREQGKYVPIIADRSTIRSLVRMNNGDVYPSSFLPRTLCRRISDAKPE